MQVNASASFRRGARSFLGADLVLTIGMPLAGALSVREFTGVLAHEFGHFTQSTAMRLGYIVQSVNRWFARVVFERDAWDQMLHEGQQSGSVTVQLMVAVSRLCVWVSRGVLWVLMVAGQSVSSFMSRQMEYNADEHHVRISGSTSFRPTHLTIHLLSAAMEQALGHLQQMWQERRLADDVVALVQGHYRTLAEDRETATRLETAVFGGSTGVLDTHPAPKDRVARASALGRAGIVQSVQPSSALFRDFTSLSKSLTLQFYQEQLGEQIPEQNLVPAEQALRARTGLEAAATAAAEFFLESGLAAVGVFATGLGIHPERPIARDLVEYRERMRQVLDECEPVLERSLAASDERVPLMIGMSLARAGIKFKAVDFGLPSEDHVELTGQWASRRDEVYELQPQLAPACLATADRAGAAFEFARTAELDMDEAISAAIRRAPVLASTFAAIEKIWPKLLPLHENVAGIQALFQFAHLYQTEEDFQRVAGEMARETAAIVQDIRRLTSQFEYPYEHAEGVVSLSAYLIPEALAADGFVIDAGAQLFERAHSLYVRMWSDVANVVLAVEKAVEQGE
jgi:hypothetical protein